MVFLFITPPTVVSADKERSNIWLWSFCVITKRNDSFRALIVSI